MIRPRIIPCLLIRNGGLVKTIQFGNEKYIGDPLNAVRIFNEKCVDELTILDIDATTQRRIPNFTLIRQLATECRMPLCYGGGVTSVEQVERIIGLGVEKVAICSAWTTDDSLIPQAGARVGRQSLVAVIDVRKNRLLNQYETMTHSGTRAAGCDPIQMTIRAERLGAGEIVINNIDLDGTMNGYDLDLLAQVRASTTLPVTALGGAGSLHDIAALIQRLGLCGAAAGSLFVFKGSLKAVLLNYPRPAEKDALLARCLASYDANQTATHQ